MSCNAREQVGSQARKEELLLLLQLRYTKRTYFFNYRVQSQGASNKVK